MHLRPFLVSAVLSIIPVFYAAGIDEVNGANLALEEEANSDDSDVKNLNAANATNRCTRPSYIL